MHPIGEVGKDFTVETPLQKQRGQADNAEKIMRL